jgi:nucleotide-binding universal stress UspA family protein
MAGDAALPPMNVLIALDFSAATSRVMATAARIAAARSSRFWLLHVVAPEPDFVGYDVGPATVRRQVAAEAGDHKTRLEQLATELRASGCEVTALIMQGATVDTVLREAGRLEAEFIVVGSHGHGAVHELLFGSVSEGIVRKSTCPVLIVPARGG